MGVTAASAKLKANQLISDWHTAANRGITDAITDIAFDNADKSKAMSGLDQALQVVAIVEPFYAAKLYSACKAAFLAGHKLTGDSLRQSSLSKASEIRSYARARADLTKQVLSEQAEKQIDRAFRVDPKGAQGKYGDAWIVRMIFHTNYCDYSDNKAILDISRVRMRFQAKLRAALLGGMRTASLQFLDDEFRRGIFDLLNQIVLDEYNEMFPNNTALTCNLQTMHKSHSELWQGEKAGTVRNWHVRLKKLRACRIVKVLGRDSSGGKFETDVVWDSNIEQRFASFELTGYTPV